MISKPRELFAHVGAPQIEHTQLMQTLYIQTQQCKAILVLFRHDVCVLNVLLIAELC